MMGTPQDRKKITDLFDPEQYDVHIKSQEPALEREARLSQAKADAAHERSRKKANEDHERRRDFLLFVSSLAIVGGAASASTLALLFSPGSSPWAAPLLTLIVGGLLGYQTGKSQSPKSGP